MLRLPSLLPLASLALALLAAGCVGEIRQTTTQRTSTEQLLISSAAERAIARFDNAERELRGRRVAIDDSRLEAVDKGYVVSALRQFVAEQGATLVPLTPTKVKDGAGREIELPPPERILEARSGALGIHDASWGVGLPALPLPIPNSAVVTTTPPLYLFFRGKQEGWAKLQLWIYDPLRTTYVARSRDLWGRSYASQWWILFVGPFDFGNDVYPDGEHVGGPVPRTEAHPPPPSQVPQKATPEGGKR